MYKLINTNNPSKKEEVISGECGRFERHTKDLSKKANSIISSVKNKILTTDDEGLDVDHSAEVGGVLVEKRYIQSAISLLERDICQIQELARKSDILKKQIDDITSYLHYEHDSIEDRLKRMGSPYLIEESFLTDIEKARTVGRPLLLEGEDGVGKRSLVYAFSAEYNHSVLRLTLHKNITQDNLYFQMCPNDEHFILGPLGHAVEELSKIAPDDNLIPIVMVEGVCNSDAPTLRFLLKELEKDHMSFNPGNFQEDIRTQVRPYVFLVNDNDLCEVPVEVYNMCFPLELKYPDALHMKQLLRLKFPEVSNSLIDDVIAKINEIRAHKEVNNKPSVREVIAWMEVLVAEKHSKIENIDGQHLEVILKNKEDHIHYKKEQEDEDFSIER